MGTLSLPTLVAPWTWVVDYIRHVYNFHKSQGINRQLFIIQLLHKVVGVNSQVPEVHCTYVESWHQSLELQVSLVVLFSS